MPVFPLCCQMCHALHLFVRACALLLSPAMYFSLDESLYLLWYHETLYIHPPASSVTSREIRCFGLNSVLSSHFYYFSSSSTIFFSFVTSFLPPTRQLFPSQHIFTQIHLPFHRQHLPTPFLCLSTTLLITFCFIKSTQLLLFHYCPHFDLQSLNVPPNNTLAKNNNTTHHHHFHTYGKKTATHAYSTHFIQNYITFHITNYHISTHITHLPAEVTTSSKASHYESTHYFVSLYAIIYSIHSQQYHYIYTYIQACLHIGDNTT